MALPESTTKGGSPVAAIVLFVPLLAAECLLLSGQRGLSAGDVIAFLAMLTSLALLILKTVTWRRYQGLALPAAAITIAVYSLHPLIFAALGGSPDWNLVAALAGISSGIVICRWKPDIWWHSWVSLIPAVPCILLHRAGVGFAPLLVASVWLFDEERKADSPGFLIGRYLRLWPALAISLAVSTIAAVIHRGDPFSASAAISGLPASVGSFAMPFLPSLGSGWTLADGLVSAGAISIAVFAAATVFDNGAAAFGLLWLLVMASLAPAQPLAAFPGLALALVATAVEPLAPALESYAFTVTGTVTGISPEGTLQ
jgi:hypothetical protein